MLAMMHEGNVVLVTGGASGIGRAASLMFAREGARLAVADRSLDGAAETVDLISADGGEATSFSVDVADEQSVSGLIDSVVERFGSLDCAFNNAGISHSPSAFHEVSAEQWNEMLAINLTGVFWCLKHEIRQMLTQPQIHGAHGTIVNTASGAGLVPAPGLPQYTAAKHGVVGLTRSVAAEYQSRIRCNSVLPGTTDTPMIRAFLEGAPQEIVDIVEASVPGAGMVQPEEIAEAAVWLCSSRSRRVNGQALVVDGGGVLH